MDAGRASKSGRVQGFMWDEAPKFNAMLLFIEHRYYGKSLPFGPESGSSLENLQHLSGEQALADFAQVITYVKGSNGRAPVGQSGAQTRFWVRVNRRLLRSVAVTARYSQAGCASSIRTLLSGEPEGGR
jgi:hypothetical protein